MNYSAALRKFQVKENWVLWSPHKRKSTKNFSRNENLSERSKKMLIVEPYAKMISPLQSLGSIDGFREFDREDGIAALRHIEYCGRISHRSEGMRTTDSWERFIKAVVMGHGDWSIVEHAGLTVEFLTDRGITHEQVRHRIGSYTQESTRFVDYDKKDQTTGEPKNPATFIYPDPVVKCEHCLAGNEPILGDLGREGGYEVGTWIHGWKESQKVVCVYDVNWLKAVDAAEAQYKKLRAKGWKPQQARSVFPNALSSKIAITYNLRNWRHFMIMRTTKEAHPQMRQLTIPLLAEFKTKIPLLFDDISPEARQVDNLKLPR